MSWCGSISIHLWCNSVDLPVFQLGKFPWITLYILFLSLFFFSGTPNYLYIGFHGLVLYFSNFSFTFLFFCFIVLFSRVSLTLSFIRPILVPEVSHTLSFLCFGRILMCKSNWFSRFFTVSFWFRFLGFSSSLATVCPLPF